MKLSGLIARLRNDLDDEAEPYLWSNADLVGYINEAIDEVCQRARLIRDSDTPDICEIRVRPNYTQYSVDHRVIQVLRARIIGQPSPLIRTGFDEMDRCMSGWEDRRASAPTHYMMDFDACWLKVYPIPTEISTMKLLVERRQLNPMSQLRLNDEPEISSHHHLNMLNWAKHLAYSIHDNEAYDAKASALHVGLFAEMFGQRQSLESEELRYRGRRHKVVGQFI